MGEVHRGASTQMRCNETATCQDQLSGAILTDLPLGAHIYCWFSAIQTSEAVCNSLFCTKPQWMRRFDRSAGAKPTTPSLIGLAQRPSTVKSYLLTPDRIAVDSRPSIGAGCNEQVLESLCQFGT